MKYLKCYVFREDVAIEAITELNLPCPGKKLYVEVGVIIS